MTGRKKGRRRSKRDLVRQFQQAFDLRRLDYARRLRPANGKAKLYGVLAAFLLYSAGFGVGYYGWHSQAVDYGVFAKLVWVLMIPATVVGVFCWLLVRNRLEYPIRRDITAYMKSLEGTQGLLWRYAPLVAELCPDNYLAKEVMALSREGKLAAIAPEDYCQAVQTLYEALQDSGSRALGGETLEELASNFSAETGPT
ncbi:MAG: hypothetical protein ACE5ET_01205 [Gammaproteobacteria bacterium]